MVDVYLVTFNTWESAALVVDCPAKFGPLDSINPQKKIQGDHA